MKIKTLLKILLVSLFALSSVNAYTHEYVYEDCNGLEVYKDSAIVGTSGNFLNYAMYKGKILTVTEVDQAHFNYEKQFSDFEDACFMTFKYEQVTLKAGIDY